MTQQQEFSSAVESEGTLETQLPVPHCSQHTSTRMNASFHDPPLTFRPRHSKNHSYYQLRPFLFLLIVVLCLHTTACLASSSDYLNEHSVVLITGAAGFLGSELAMALHRTYKVKQIICVDSMDSTIGTPKTEEELALFEFKRQRAFHLMQTLGKTAVFYRADFRPSIPEYFDMGEVPILDYLVRDHGDITHVVHLAEDKTAGVQAVPRIKEDVSSGMMEALLEQIVKFQKTPHFVYGSSYEVYNHLHPTDINPVPFSEDKPITTPSTLRGAAKIIDELLARTYHSTHDIFSVGLRFFPVYGPWGVPGSPLFEMAERAVTEAPIVGVEESDVLDDVRDYVYIDDAVDALMAAMQYRTPDNSPVVMNVGTGKGTSLRQVARQVQDLLPRATSSLDENVNESSSSRTVSYANTDRAKMLLGFQSRVSLDDGLVRLLSWHYDRAFPYGGRPPDTSADEATKNKRNYIASQGIVSCSPFDKECLRGAPVFPCASECSHESKCTTSVYDDVLIFTRTLTAKCSTVMYTVDLRQGLDAIPSANMAISTHHSSHLEDGCNIAFVSESSSLVTRLKQEQGFSLLNTAVETFIKYASKSKGKTIKVLKHGFWTLVPVSMPNFETGDEHILDLLPKLSPGLFFGEATTHAIYCDPDVVFKDVPTLLQEAKRQPYRAGTQGATAMLVARERPPKRPFGGDDEVIGGVIPVNESIQNAAYRMVRIGVIDEMSGDGYHPLLDSSWVVHALLNEDSRLFRCDIFGEVVQWDVATDEKAFEFIMGLHDMWSRVIVQEKGNDPWWLGDGVITIPQSDNVMAPMRRLQEAQDVPNEGAGDQEVAEQGDSENIEDRNQVEGVEEGRDIADVADDEAEQEGGNDANEKVDGAENGDNNEGLVEDAEIGNEGDQVEEAQELGEDAAGDNAEQDGGNDANEELDEAQELGENNAGDNAEQDGANDANVEVDEAQEPDSEDGQVVEDEEVDNEGDQVDEARESDNEEDQVVDTAEDDTKDDEVDNAQDEGAVQVGDINPEDVLNMKEEVNEEEASKEDEMTPQDEKDKAFAAEKHAEGGDNESPENDNNEAIEKENPVADAAGEGDNEGFLNAGAARVDVTSQEGKAQAEQETEDDDEENKETDDNVGQEEEEEGDAQQAKIKSKTAEIPADLSSYDTWMGVLSSTSTHYFVRIVPSSEVGATYLDDYKY